METGSVVEYIDKQKIVIAVVSEVKTDRLRLLTESNREVKLSAGRILHKSRQRLNMSSGRDRQIEALKEIALRRRALTEQVRIRDLWEISNSEQQWIDLMTMTELCFPENPTDDCESAVLRTFFNDRLYFRFSPEGFFPNTEEQVRQLELRAEEDERRNRLIELGSAWIRNAIAGNANPCPASLGSEERSEITTILTSLYLHEKESPHHPIGKTILDKAGIGDSDALFQTLIRLGIWNPNENLDLYRYDVPVAFSEDAETEAAGLICRSCPPSEEKVRKDLTQLPLMTIDGQSTSDYDDALSIDEKEDHYLLGVHIADVGHCVGKGRPIDADALLRGSSIYMPDMKIPMLPPSLAEDLCSLKAGELRPGISVMIRLDKNSFAIEDYDIFPSLIRIKKQLTYYEVNTIAEEDRDIFVLHQIAAKFRQKRLNDGAIHISLPEVNVWLTEEGELMVSKTNRESPGRMLVSEIMIMANWLMAKFLSERGLPAIFRSQPEPKERLYEKDGGTLFQNWMQRRLLSRFVLSARPERHAGLGLDAYLTATSPIRKYFDLLTQRQIRSVYGLDTPYTTQEIERSLHLLEQPMLGVSRLQYLRKRYWLLKYLEERVGKKEEALVLGRRRNGYQILLTEYLIECILPVPAGVSLRIEDQIQVGIQHANARKDTLSVQMA